MTYLRIYAGPDGESHCEDVDVEMAWREVFPGLPLLAVGSPIAITSLVMVRFPPAAHHAGWRRPPQRQFVVFGADVQIEVSDGAVRRVRAGSPVLFEDTHGKGHATHVLSEDETLVLFLPLPAS